MAPTNARMSPTRRLMSATMESDRAPQSWTASRKSDRRNRAFPAKRRSSERHASPMKPRVGGAAIAWGIGFGETLGFIGEACLSLLRLFAGKARFRRSDLLLAVQDCGARSLSIVALINLLVGLILAFVGAIQLRRFGAQIYVADLVGI